MEAAAALDVLGLPTDSWGRE